MAKRAIPVQRKPRTANNRTDPRVHLVAASPWRQAVECYYSLDDDADVDGLTFAFPDSWVADDVFVVLTSTSPTPAILALEVAESPSTDGKDIHSFRGPFRHGLSVRAVEERLGTSLPAAPYTLDEQVGAALLTAIDQEEDSPTSWRIHDELGCLAAAERSAGPQESGQREWARCAVCDHYPSVDVNLELHQLREADERELFGHRQVSVCVTCHDELHHPLALSAGELLFDGRPPCPRCSATRTHTVIWGEPIMPTAPASIIAGCVIRDPFVLEFHCSECEYDWTENDAAYQDLRLGTEGDGLARARIAPPPEGVYGRIRL